MAELVSLDALILTTATLREHDVRVVFFSREYGLGDAVATGAKKITSKQRMRLEPGTITRLTIARGKQFDRLTTSEPYMVPATIRASLHTLLALQFFLGLIFETTRKGDVNPVLFASATQLVQELECVGDSDEAVKRWCTTAAERIMDANGFAIESGKPLRTQMEYVFEKQLRPWKLLAFVRNIDQPAV